MTISITRARRGRRSTVVAPVKAGFTLVEILIGSTLGTLVLAGVLSAYLMLGRSGTRIVSYITTDTETRRAMEEFAQDVRMARGITWTNSTSITLTVPDNYSATSNRVTYGWDNTTGSPTYRCFFRMPGEASTSNIKTVLIRKITSFAYSRFDRVNAAATTDAATKRLQITFAVTSSSQTVVASTAKTVTTSYVMRNKTST